MTKNNSRRLKHHRESFTFQINCDVVKPNIEEIFMKNILEFSQLSHKTIMKGGSKEKDIKQIDGQADIQIIKGGVLVQASIHIHHYANVYFDINPFLARLNSELGLKPGSVVSVVIKSSPPIVNRPELKKERITSEPTEEKKDNDGGFFC